MSKTAWPHPYPSSTSYSVRQKRQAPPSGHVKMYTVSSEGDDNTECLSYETTNKSCATIAYIIYNGCNMYPDLQINLLGNISQPCAENDTSFTAECNIIIKGFEDSKQVVISKDPDANVSNCQLFPTSKRCSMAAYMTQPLPCNSTSVNLHALNATFKDIVLDATGYNLSFTNVIFHQSKIVTNASMTHTCFLFCKNCNFISYLEDLQQVTNTSNETVSNLPYAVNLLDCVNVTVVLHNAHFLSSYSC